MPPTKKAAVKPARKAARSVHKAKHVENDRLIRRITSSLDVAQTDLGNLRGSVGSGVNDLRRDLGKLLRSARRDAERLGKATRKDLERLQRDGTSAARIRPHSTRSAGSRRSPAKAAAKPKSR
jgi:hypothetical protein